MTETPGPKQVHVIVPIELFPDLTDWFEERGYAMDQPGNIDNLVVFYPDVPLAEEGCLCCENTRPVDADGLCASCPMGLNHVHPNEGGSVSRVVRTGGSTSWADR